jgi:hypothetical protein
MIMAHALQTRITKLFPRARGMRLTEITIEDDSGAAPAHRDGADRRLPVLCRVGLIRP